MESRDAIDLAWRVLALRDECEVGSSGYEVAESVLGSIRPLLHTYADKAVACARARREKPELRDAISALSILALLYHDDTTADLYAVVLECTE